MGLLVACKNEENPIKNEGARVVTTLFINFSDAQGQLTRKVSNGILRKFKLIQALKVVLIVCKNEEKTFKIECTRVVTTFLPLKVYRDFFKHSRAGNS